MSSREIAELTGKRHSNVKRDTKTMMDGLGLAHLNFEDSYTDPTGWRLPCYHPQA